MPLNVYNSGTGPSEQREFGSVTWRWKKGKMVAEVMEGGYKSSTPRYAFVSTHIRTISF